MISISHLKVNSYRSFNKEGVELRELPYVSYLVGPNGSGKSTVLQYLLENFSHLNVYKIQDSLSVNQIVSVIQKQAICNVLSNTELFEQFENKQILIPEFFLLVQHKYPSIWQLVWEICHKVGILSTDLSKNFSQNFDKNLDENIIGGNERLVLLIFSIVYAIKEKKSKLLLLEGPENYLYPALQKKLPEIFSLLAKKFYVQLFVATHSPFITSAVARLAQLDDELNHKNNHQNEGHYQNQNYRLQDLAKVYFLQDGRVVDKKSQPSIKAQFGYWGGKVIDIAGFLLGSGLADFVSSQPQQINYPVPTIIMCEGEGEFSDSRIYNRIFRFSDPSITFVSSKGVSQLERSYGLFNQIKPGLSSEFNLKMLRDRDHEFPNLESVRLWEKEYKQGRVLHRRALEAYLFTQEIAEKVLEKFGLKLTDYHQKQLAKVERRIQKQAVNGVLGDEYKHEMETVFHNATQKCVLKYASKKESLLYYLAQFVTPETKAYQELFSLLQEEDGDQKSDKKDNKNEEESNEENQEEYKYF